MVNNDVEFRLTSNGCCTSVIADNEVQEIRYESPPAGDGWCKVTGIGDRVLWCRERSEKKRPGDGAEQRAHELGFLHFDHEHGDTIWLWFDRDRGLYVLSLFQHGQEAGRTYSFIDRDAAIDAARMCNSLCSANIAVCQSFDNREGEFHSERFSRTGRN
jgi:hypothetical protein